MWSGRCRPRKASIRSTACDLPGDLVCACQVGERAGQGGDSQDQNLLQFFLNVVEFGMTVQQAVEAPNVNSYQMRSSFGAHESRPGRMTVASSLPKASRQALRQMGYTLEVAERTSGRSTRSSSTGNIGRCGVGRAITERITGLGGEGRLIDWSLRGQRAEN